MDEKNKQPMAPMPAPAAGGKPSGMSAKLVATLTFEAYIMLEDWAWSFADPFKHESSNVSVRNDIDGCQGKDHGSITTVSRHHSASSNNF
jgi:hypothetical protein